MRSSVCVRVAATRISQYLMADSDRGDFKTVVKKIAPLFPGDSIQFLIQCVAF